MEAGDTIAQSGDLAHIFVTDGHTGLDMLSSPIVPVVDMDIGAANSSLMDLDQNFAGTGDGYGNTSQRNAFAGVGLNKSIHHLLRHGLHSLF